jgi:hypothetical protein
MTIIADRGLFVRLLVQSGKFEAGEAESFADALDAATKEPATRVDLTGATGELRAELQQLRGEVKLEIAGLRQDVALLSQRVDAQTDRIIVRLGGVMVVLLGLLFAALRLL